MGDPENSEVPWPASFGIGPAGPAPGHVPSLGALLTPKSVTLLTAKLGKIMMACRAVVKIKLNKMWKAHILA